MRAIEIALSRSPSRQGLSGRILSAIRVAPRSMTISGWLAQWHAVYVEPNVWMRHAL